MLQKIKEQILKNDSANDIVRIDIVNINGDTVLPIKRIDTNTWVMTIDKKEQVVHLKLQTNEAE